MFLYASGWTVLVKVALGDLWKNNIKRVHISQEVIVYEVDAKSEELSTEKSMCEVNLQTAIKQIENFTEDHLCRPPSIHLHVLEKCCFNLFELNFTRKYKQ